MLRLSITGYLQGTRMKPDRFADDRLIEVLAWIVADTSIMVGTAPEDVRIFDPFQLATQTGDISVFSYHVIVHNDPQSQKPYIGIAPDFVEGLNETLRTFGYFRPLEWQSACSMIAENVYRYHMLDTDPQQLSPGERVAHNREDPVSYEIRRNLAVQFGQDYGLQRADLNPFPMPAMPSDGI